MTLKSGELLQLQSEDRETQSGLNSTSILQQREVRGITEPHLTASKELETSVLESQGTRSNDNQGMHRRCVPLQTF